MTEDNRKDIVAYRIERANTALEQAKLNLQMNCLEVTANRLYYAAYYAVSALLIANKIPAHSHEGNVTQFGLHFVKTGIVDREDGKLLSHLLTMRIKGDYSDRFGLTEDDVVPYIEPTEAFIKKIVSLAEQMS
ncbi:MAG: HEPN domain-containing protein [Prevotella sp.]|jgi:uncharacterized protein (UPF0332 family)|nr:HEPN domain-containing protein [Prevotella sp.]